MLQTFFYIIWLLLPAGAANSIPVIASHYNWLPALAKPIDGGTNILGQNKTVRGFILGIIFGSITGYLEYTTLGLEPFDQPLFSVTFGGLLGLGALLGDALKSFIKRRLDIAPGNPWRPFDQIDAVIGALIVASLFVQLHVLSVIFAIILFGILSWLTSVLGVQLQIKKSV